MTNNYDHQMRVWEKQVESSIALFQGVVAFATLSIKSLLIFNGGAILALLTFYGNVLVRSGNSTIAIDKLTSAFTAFVVGVGAALFCSMGAYIAQVLFTESADDSGGQRCASIVRGIAVAAAIGSFVAFVVGAFASINALESLNVPYR